MHLIENCHLLVITKWLCRRAIIGTGVDRFNVNEVIKMPEKPTGYFDDNCWMRTGNLNSQRAVLSLHRFRRNTAVVRAFCFAFCASVAPRVVSRGGLVKRFINHCGSATASRTARLKPRYFSFLIRLLSRLLFRFGIPWAQRRHARLWPFLIYYVGKMERKFHEISLHC